MSTDVFNSTSDSEVSTACFLSQPFESLTQKDQIFVQNVCDVLTGEHPPHSSPIKLMMELTNVSERTLRRKILRLFGMPPSELITKQRVAKACELLSTDKSIAEISESLGFCEPSYFSTVFKSVTQRAPSAYRKQNRAELTLAH